MKKVSYRQFVLLLLVLQGAIMPAQAGIEQECRQEAADYGLEAEIVEQYIQDCIYSRGGYPEVDADAMVEQQAQDVMDENMTDPAALRPEPH